MIPLASSLLSLAELEKALVWPGDIKEQQVRYDGILEFLFPRTGFCLAMVDTHARRHQLLAGRRACCGAGGTRQQTVAAGCLMVVVRNCTLYPFFLWRSLYGGVDVARRALHPKLPISPGLFDYRWRLPPGLPRVFMANTVSLLPGTLSAELGEEYLHVHVLDRSGDFIPELSIVEEHVARLFGLHLIDAESEE
jgi:multisubunit Na+/H+ antiporter MnhE subunit